MSYIGTQPVPQSLESRQEFTATASQTTFATNGYTVGYVDVYLNGVKLSTSDFTATNGSDVILGSGATEGDVLAVVMKNDHSDLVALPITDSQGNNVLSESGSVVTLTADEANVGSNALVVNSSGDVGIHTSSPQGDLDVRNGTNQTVIIGNSGSYAGGEYGRLMFKEASTELAYLQWNGTGNEFRLMNRLGTLTFGTDNNEKMRIDSSGNVLVGTTSLPSSSAQGVRITNPVLGACLFSSGAITSNVNQLAFVNGNGTVGTITTSGSATVYNTSSDYRLKENITEITDGITRVKQLNPSRFNFISDPDKIVDGFIAHEVQDIVPEAVSGEKDAVDSDRKPEYQGVDYGRITPLLTAALKEAIAKIEMLETRIAVLEAK